MPTLGQRIRMLRNTHNMKQSELADAMHVSKFTVSAWERDLQKPEYNKLESLSRLFNTSVTLSVTTSETRSVTLHATGKPIR